MKWSKEEVRHIINNCFCQALNNDKASMAEMHADYKIWADKYMKQLINEKKLSKKKKVLKYECLEISFDISPDRILSFSLDRLMSVMKTYHEKAKVLESHNRECIRGNGQNGQKNKLSSI